MPFKIDLDRQPAQFHVASSAAVTFRDLPGPTLSKQYDFSHALVEVNRITDIAASFYSLYIRASRQVRNQAFLAIREFIEYLAKNQFESGAEEPLYRYVEYLLVLRNSAGQTRTLNGCHLNYGYVAAVLRYAKHTLDPAWLMSTDVPMQPFKKSRRTHSAKNIISKIRFEAIETAAISAIETHEDFGDQHIAQASDLIPYAILLTTRCLINSEPLRLLKRDCLKQGVNPKTITITWTKYRSHSVCTLQDSKRPFRGPDLVTRLLKFTKPLVPLVVSQDAELLMLCQANQYGRLKGHGIITPAAFQYQLEKFFQKRGLQRCTLGDLRATAMTFDVEARRDPESTQRIANHATLAQTLYYFRTPEGTHVSERIISDAQSRFEGLFLDSIASPPSHADDEPPTLDIQVGEQSQLLGFICANPLNGVGPGSKIGEVCPSFFGCFTCPNAMFPNQPEAVARLLQLRTTLLDNAAQMPPERWRLIFAPIISILDRDLLPKISHLTIERAHKLVAKLPQLPDLTYLNG